MPSVEIALATYNGGEYLAEQIDSLMEQTAFQHTRILLGDDGSSDDTIALISQLQQRHSETIILLPKGPGLGASANFGRILEATRADYVFLCDQDDHWDADKMEKSLRAIEGLAAVHGNEKPLLVFTDLRVVDRNKQTIAPSLWAFQGINPRACQLRELLMQNVVTGCTVVVNRALLEKALPIPQEAIMHDWWLALVASACGAILPVEQTTMSYRQHGKNEVGARQWSVQYILDRAVQLLKRETAGHHLERLLNQAGALHNRCRAELPEVTKCQVEELAALMSKNIARRVWVSVSRGWRRQGVIRNLGWFMILIWAKNRITLRDVAQKQQKTTCQKK